MLNVGIIGITEILEPHVKRLQKNKNINVIGKTSVGTSAQLNGFHFSIPEFNRVELIERSDVLLIDNSSPIPFDTLSDIIKKSKHIFVTEYLNITTAECGQLVKLAHESGSVVQVINPFYYMPAIQWLNNTISKPLFLDISKSVADTTLHEAIFPLLLMLVETTGISTKKVGGIIFNSDKKEIDFANVRLEFGDASVVNINFGKQISVNKFKIKGVAKNQVISLNFENDVFLLNQMPIDFSDFLSTNEFDRFVESAQNQSQSKSNFEDYYNTMQLVDSIEKKFIQFID